MSEKVLGVLQVDRGGGTDIWLSPKVIHEELVITSDRVLVIRKWEQHKGGSVGTTSIIDVLSGLAFDASRNAQSKKKMREREKQANTLEELFKAHKNNFAIPNSEIIKVVLSRSSHKWWGSRGTISISTSKKQYKWCYGKQFPGKEDVKLEEDYENILRPAFGDKLSVKK